MRKMFFCLTIIAASAFCFAQESLCSVEDEYFQFLNLKGLIESPTLNYKTLSDSEWNCEGIEDEQNVWKENNLGTKYILFSPQALSQNFFVKGLNQKVAVKIYSPDWYSSYNTAAPFGQNDGALWQGRGYNTSLTAGVRVEAYGFELTAKPQVSFSQNKYFEIMPSSISEYGYFWGYGVDAPQRFGDKPFWNFDWGDTEARFTWHTFTLGFGTQAIWLGPAKENPLLFSNNAAIFPKFDIGLRKTKVIIPGVNWDAGEIEGRWWLGKLSESEYFDDNSDNDFRRLLVLTLSYAPSFIPGLTIGATKVTLTQWLDDNPKYLNPFYNDNIEEDQKASVTLDWKLPASKFELYSEIGIDDFVPDGRHGLYGYLRNPFHTMTCTFGFRKECDFKNDKSRHLLIDFEYNTTEMSQDFQMQWPYNFGFHNIVTHGYTNEGQWLGSGIGYGGNSQKLTFTCFKSHSYHKYFIGRNNPDNNYIYSKAINATKVSTNLTKYFTSYKANFYVGYKGCYFVTKSFLVCPGFTYDLLINPLYETRVFDEERNTFHYLHNFNLSLELKYQF